MKRPRITTLEPLAPAVMVVLTVHAVLALLAFRGWQELPSSNTGTELAWLNPAVFRDPMAAAEPPKAVLIRPPVPTPQKTTPASPKAPPKPADPPVEAPAAMATLIAMPPQQAMLAPVEGTPLFAGAAAPKPAANRNITLRRAVPKPKSVISAEIQVPAPPISGATLADMARLNRLRPGQLLLPPPPVESKDELPPGLNMDLVDNAVNTAFEAAWTAPPLNMVPANQRSATLTLSVDRDGRVFGSQMVRPSGSHPLDDSILSAVAKVMRIETTLPAQFPKQTYDLELTFTILP